MTRHIRASSSGTIATDPVIPQPRHRFSASVSSDPIGTPRAFARPSPKRDRKVTVAIDQNGAARLKEASSSSRGSGGASTGRLSLELDGGGGEILSPSETTGDPVYDQASATPRQGGSTGTQAEAPTVHITFPLPVRNPVAQNPSSAQATNTSQQTQNDKGVLSFISDPIARFHRWLNQFSVVAMLAIAIVFIASSADPSAWYAVHGGKPMSVMPATISQGLQWIGFALLSAAAHVMMYRLTAWRLVLQKLPKSANTDLKLKCLSVMSGTLFVLMTVLLIVLAEDRERQAMLLLHVAFLCLLAVIEFMHWLFRVD